ncbi:nuclear transport factor 2 family protein [Kribbella sp. NPDC023855]|uniref:nuclear transport factor 2 family protein n=1 Tax=Kribbella sp. NPDC023855 TaxID=3154698 RepID=UPI0033D5D42D
MSEDHTPVEVAVAYIEAFGRGDMVAAAQYVADEIEFESPMTRIRGAAGYLEAVGQFARGVTGVEIIGAVGDERRALVMYEMTTTPYGVLAAADHFVVADGKITGNRLVFDTYPIRGAQV